MRAAAIACAALLACGGGSADDPSDAGGGADAVPGACPTPLDDATLAELTTSILGQPGIQPGESRTLQLGVVECCYTFEPVAACAIWSVRPGDPATIDPATGQLVVDATANDGDVIVATADVEQGRRLVTTDLHVYTPEANPLYGIWRETAQLACGSYAEVTPEHTINELWFRAGDELAVTWYPFEVYVDYWGSYDHDLATGELAITVTGGNYVPTDIDPAGTFDVDGDRLTLRDLYLGSYRDSSDPARCGHIFER